MVRISHIILYQNIFMSRYLGSASQLAEVLSPALSTLFYTQPGKAFSSIEKPNNPRSKQQLNMNCLELLFEENFVKEAIAEFVRKVYLLLENPAYYECVCWASDERTMVIKDTDLLVQQVLPVVFNQKTLKSFIRQLNMYSFKKVRDGPEPNYLYFRNAHFMRGNIQQLIFIKRKQRGYVEKSKLQNQKTKTLLQKYNIFTSGVLNKLRLQINSLSDSYPRLCTDLLTVLKTQSPSNLHQTQNQPPVKPATDEPMTRCEKPYAPYATLFESVYELCQFPPEFRTELSILGDSAELELGGSDEDM